MDMFDEEVVLCASSAYEKKFYLNEEFSRLPEDIKNELKIMCVLFTEEVGGILELVFDEEGNLLFRTDADEKLLLISGCVPLFISYLSRSHFIPKYAAI